MLRPPGTSSAAVRFLNGLRRWLYGKDDAPNVVDLRVTDGTPCVVYQVPSDSAGALLDLVGEMNLVLGGCTGAFKGVDYAVDEVVIVGLPNDREAHEAALRWRFKADWAREYADDELSHEELIDRFYDTQEMLENL